MSSDNTDPRRAKVDLSSHDLVAMVVDRPLESCSVLLVDRRSLLTESVASVLREYAPELQVRASPTIDEAEVADAALVVIWLDSDALTASQQVGQKIKEVRARFPGAAVSAFVACETADVLLECMKAQVSVMNWRSATRPIALASIRLALAGATFATMDLFKACKSSLAGWLTHSNKDERNQSSLLDSSVALAEFSREEGDHTRFTPRELEIVSHISRGLPNKVIAFEMGISSATVKVHVQNIMKKLHATNRTQVALILNNVLDRRREKFH